MGDEILDVIPFKNRSKIGIKLPGSKSISNRALILAVLNQGPVELRGILDSDDVNIMLAALKDLGIKIRDGNKSSIYIEGTGGKIPVKSATINVGNAGTVARFLTSLLALQEGSQYILDGTEAMRKRPMGGLIKSLEEHGARFEYLGEKEHFPFKIFCNGLNSSDWFIDASESSQILSAILLIAPCIKGKKTIQLKGSTVSKPFVTMTLKMMEQFSRDSGYNVFSNLVNYSITSFDYNISDEFYQIEPDATAASYFLSLPISVNGEIHIENIQDCILQGDINYCDVIAKCGVKLDYSKSGITSHVSSSITGGVFDFNDISDTFLTLAALSPLLKTPLSINGISHTRKQETDRVSGMVNQLKKIVDHVEESHDSIRIVPDGDFFKKVINKPIEIETYEDHRFAMSFAILGSFDLLGNNQPWLRIIDPMCCTKTFPNFFKTLDFCRTKVENGQ